MAMSDTPDKITYYRPNQRHELGLFKTWLVMLRNVIGSRDLIWQLFKRDFFAGYKKSFIGIGWRFVAPITGIISWVFLKEMKVLDPGDVGMDYVPYVLTGQMVWGLFRGFLGSARSTLSSGGGLVMQVNYPHEALLFKQLANQMSGFMFALATNLVVLFAYGYVPSWKIIFFPLVILPLFFLGVAMGLILSMVSVVAVDLNRIVNFGIGLLVWVTPVRFSQKFPNKILQTIMHWNPLTYFICSARNVVVFGTLYEPKMYFIYAGACFVIFMIAWRLFYVSENKIIERMI